MIFRRRTNKENFNSQILSSNLVFFFNLEQVSALR